MIKVDKVASRNAKALQTPVLDAKGNEIASRKASKATSSQYSAFKATGGYESKTPQASENKLPDIH